MWVQAYKGQSMADIAVMHCGAVEYCAEIAEANSGLTSGAIDYVIEANSLIVVPDTDNAVARRMKQRETVVCTCLKDVER